MVERWSRTLISLPTKNDLLSFLVGLGIEAGES